MRVDIEPRRDIPMDEIEVALQIGADDCRGNSQLRLELVGSSGRTQRFDNINGGRGLPRWTDHLFRLRLPTGWRTREVGNLRMSYNSGRTNIFDTTDNIDLVTLRVTAIRGGRHAVLFLQGDTDNDPERSLWRFKGERPNVTFSTNR